MAAAAAAADRTGPDPRKDKDFAHTPPPTSTSRPGPTSTRRTNERIPFLLAWGFRHGRLCSPSFRFLACHSTVVLRRQGFGDNLTRPGRAGPGRPHHPKPEHAETSEVAGGLSPPSRRGGEDRADPVMWRMMMKSSGTGGGGGQRTRAPSSSKLLLLLLLKRKTCRRVSAATHCPRSPSHHLPELQGLGGGPLSHDGYSAAPNETNG